jgi:nucleotide-binding universal stress UspA family protein
VDVVHVHPWLAKEAADAVLLPRAWEQTQAARDRLARANVPWRLHSEMGDPATRIIALAQELGSTGIVMGSHGHGAVDQLMLGSVSYKVLHLARVPVLVVG